MTVGALSPSWELHSITKGSKCQGLDMEEHLPLKRTWEEPGSQQRSLSSPDA